MMAKLRGGTGELGIEIERWHGLRREDRVCKECGSGEVEDTEHFVMRCAYGTCHKLLEFCRRNPRFANHGIP